jgi:hypothetical protein
MATKVQTRIQSGQCIHCGVQLGEPGDTTRRCAKDAREHSRTQSIRQLRKRTKFREEQKCIDCGDKREKGSSRCDFHSLRHTLNDKDRRAREAGRPLPSRPK